MKNRIAPTLTALALVAITIFGIADARAAAIEKSLIGSGIADSISAEIIGYKGLDAYADGVAIQININKEEIEREINNIEININKDIDIAIAEQIEIGVNIDQLDCIGNKVIARIYYPDIVGISAA